MIFIKLHARAIKELAYHGGCDCHGWKGEHGPKPMWKLPGNPVLAVEILVNYSMIRWVIEMSRVLKGNTA